MSSAPEVIVGRQCNMRCFCLALVTNVCVLRDDNTTKHNTDPEHYSAIADGLEKGPNHEEVLSAGLSQARNIQLFFHAFITEVGKTVLKKS